MDTYEGILLIDKHKDCTSHDIVDMVRRCYKMKSVGHAGTLDPMATGLLILLIGKATKVSQYLMSSDKTYEGEMTLGCTTNTQDAEGEITAQNEVPDFTQEHLLEKMKSFLGDQYQTPPMFSAKKVNGVPLYKMARKGQEVKREPRFIRISKFELLNWQKPLLQFRLDCSKGTYVRTIANDFGQALGCGAMLSALRRTKSGSFDVANAITIEELKTLPPSQLQKRLIPIRDAVPSFAL